MSADLFFSDGKTKVSRAEFAKQVNATAIAWRATGINSQSVILIPSGRGVIFFIEIIAAWILGSTAVPLDNKISEDKLAHLLTVLGAPESVFCQELIHSLNWENDSFLAVDAILFTSGSSGTPKGVLHTIDNLIGNSLATLDVTGLNRNDHLFFNIPYHFTSAICHFLSALISGASLTAIERKLFPVELHQEIDIAMPNCFGGSPIQLLWLSSSSIILFPHINWFMSSGDDLPIVTIQSLKSKYPASNVFVVYGLTEIGGRGCILLPEFVEARMGSVGKSINGLSVSIRDENFSILPANQAGGIFFSGDYLLSGFVEQRHNSDITEFGYFTGDLGYIDDDGFLFLQGRSDDVFKVAGKKVSALLIRRAILDSDYVDDAAVIPQKDEILGCVPIAFVVPKNIESFTKAKLLRFLRQNLPSDNIPKSIISVQKIPRTDSGKIIKKEIVNLLDS
ncbi:MAG: class I adenylate-forming enzyme family protein [Pseudomonadota bacterium]